DRVDLVAFPPQQVGGRLGEYRLVVGQQDPANGVHCVPPSEIGSRTVNTAPPPGTSPTSSSPPAAVTLRDTIVSPSPIPLVRSEESLVVKNGSKMRSLRCTGTPGPWSDPATVSVRSPTPQPTSTGPPSC